jgi:hypothetical protein
MNNPSAGSKKTNTLPGGGNITTSKDGKTMTINGASSIRIDPATGNIFPSSSHHRKPSYAASSPSYSQSSKTGVTFKRVSSYTSSDEYKKASSDSASAKPRP